MASDTEATSTLRNPSITSSPEGCASSHPPNASTGSDAKITPRFISFASLANLGHALVVILLILFFQFRIARGAVNIARFVFAFVELLTRPLVVNVNVIGLIYH